MIETKDVTLSEQGITVKWSDDHEAIYPYRYLRGECPCAGCLEEMTGRRVVGPNDVPEDVEALDWMQVGSYALRFLWSDLHDTGIYPFTLLRALCPCPDCSKE